MRLVLVHGRAQGRRCAADIHAEWMPALELGCRAAGVRLPAELEVRIPYYGDILDTATAELLNYDSSTIPRGVVPEYSGTLPEFADDFKVSATLALAKGAGITDEDISAESGDTIQRGAVNWAWVQAAGRLISRRCPWFGDLLMRELTEDVYAYMTQPDICETINDIVSNEIGDGPAVVVGHSLGTIVSYWTLSQLSYDLVVPMLITLGSPLGIDAVKALLPRPLGMPSPVQHWLNASDERDPVALISRLDRDHFPAEIENLSDIHNPRSNPHAIVGYLSDTVVAKRIAEAVSRA